MPEPSHTVDVRVLLTVGDQAEIVADAHDAGDPERYPAAEIARALDVEPRDLPGMRLTADVGRDHRLTNWRRR
ncbi:hypothetical protein FOE67_08200 [Streptomyces calidiresistens]|uniref:Uncharacterized protein n=2 Tax=Streptomyces calidiresistens TaxID=1485586 RepID=A0A7W3T228_9ACTN|nr:hypothetical protein [Streptomyces calidiresistens]